MMEITIKGGGLEDPRQRILAIEAAAEAICRQAGTDPADATMMLLTAAVHLASKRSKKPVPQMLETLAGALGAATVAADDFFKLRTAPAPSALPENPPSTETK
jgi:hypothetical protein